MMMKNNSGLSSETDLKGVPFGRYVLLRKLAHGGMAEVFLGHEKDGPLDGPLYVIKCILPDLARDPQFLAMFINEAQLAAQMKHPNIVRVVDFGDHEGRLYMAMEFVDGLDCWRFARRLYPWGKTPEEHTALTAWIICRVLSALEYVHGVTDVNGKLLNVVHRDLSPSNIYLSHDGEVKLGDFGIARIDSERYRKVKIIPRGKFGYVAPEQVEGLPVDTRADIFATGIVFTELLIGKKMFSGSSQLSVLLEIKDGRLDTLEQNIDMIEPKLLKILRNALAQNPDHRYKSALQFRLALEEYCQESHLMVTPGTLAKQISRAVELGDTRSSVPYGNKPKTPITKQIPGLDTIASLPPTLKRELQGEHTPDFWNEPGNVEGIAASDTFGTPAMRESTPFGKEWRYNIRLSDGRTIGPTSYAHVIELICSDVIGAETLISVDGSPYIAAEEYPELTRHLPAYTPTMDVDEIETPDRRGVFQLEAPAEVMLTLAVSQETGMLICTQGTMRKELYYDSGEIVYVSSNSPDELLGECLVESGAIGRDDLNRALKLLPKFDGHLGDTLIAMGVMTAAELFQQIGRQIRSRFSDLISWRSGRYEFYRGVSCALDVLEIPFEIYHHVSHTLVNLSGALEVDSTLDVMMESVVLQTPSAPDILRYVDFPGELDEIIRDLLEPSTVRDLRSLWRGQQGEKKLAMALFVAVEAGLWMVEGPPPPWRSADVESPL